MPGGWETIKEYLIGMGFAVNMQQYNDMVSRIKGLENLATGATKNIDSGLAKAAMGAAAFYTTAAAAVAGFVSAIAGADMKTQVFARRMWMTYDNAKTLQAALSAMGADMSDLGDIAFNPELRERFFALRSEAYKLAPPADFELQMRKVRDIEFQFSRLKLTISYGVQWVGYYISKYLPIEQWRKWLEDFNNRLQVRMPDIAAKIGKVLAGFLQMIVNGAKAVNEIRQVVFDFFSELPARAKALAAALAAIGVAMLNPFTAVIMAIGAIFLMIDDYMTYLRGGKTEWQGLWEAIDPQKKGFKGLEETKTFGALRDTLKDIAEFAERIKNAFAWLDQKFQNATGMSIIEAGLKSIDNLLSSIFGTINGIISTINAALNGDFGDYFKKLFGLLFQYGNKGFGNFGLGGGFGWAFGMAGDIMQWLYPKLKNQSYQGYKGGSLTVSPTYNIYGTTGESVLTAADRHLIAIIRSNKGVFV